MSLFLVVPTPAVADGAGELMADVKDGPCKVVATCSCPMNPQDYLFRLGDYVEECQQSS